MGEIFKTIVRSWSRHFVTHATAIVVLSAIYSLAIFLLVSTTSGRKTFMAWGKINEMTVYATEKNRSLTRTSPLSLFLENHQMVKSVNWVSSAQSASEFHKEYAAFIPKSTSSTELSEFFPPYYRVFLKSPLNNEVSVDQATLLAATLKSRFTEVDDVSFGQTWMNRFIQVANYFEYFSYVLVVFLLLGASFVTSNVLKTIIYARQNEIEILSLVGATRLSIFIPHALNTIILSFLSLVIGLGFNYVVFDALIFSLRETLNLDIALKMSDWPISFLFFVISFLFIITLMASFFSVSKLLLRSFKGNRRKFNLYGLFSKGSR